MHVTSNLGGGGVERLLVKSLGVFDHTGFDHKVCCFSGGLYEGELRAMDIPYWIIQRRWRFDPSFIFKIASLMRREHVDVVHTLNFTANAWGRAAAKIAGVPRIIAHERGTAWTESSAMRMVDRFFYRFTDLLLANSNAAINVLTKHVGLPKERIHLIYNGVPKPTIERKPRSSLREMLGISSSTYLVGTIGRLDTPKGHIYLLHAIPKVWLSLPNVTFVIIGDGPLHGYLKREAHSLGLIDKGDLHFLGFLDNAPDLLHDLDLLVHPAIREPLGNVLIEASLNQIPIIASKVDGCPEVVVDGQTGTLVECTQPVTYVDAPGASPLPAVVVDGGTRQLRPPLGPNPEDLASAIVQLLQNPHLREQMGNRARTRSETLFNIERYVRDLEDAYRGT